MRRVEQRKLLLDMSVSFHTHTKEVRRVDGKGALAGLICSGKGQGSFPGKNGLQGMPRGLGGLEVTNLLTVMILTICS